MNFFVLSAVFINLIVSITQSHSDTSTQQVTLSCPCMPEGDLRGPPGVPGKRGSKGEFGSPGQKGDKGEKGESDSSTQNEIEALQEQINFLLNRTAPLERKGCDDIYRLGIGNTNGVYNLFIAGKLTAAYCELQNDDQKWLVIQRNFERNINYDLNWSEYKAGFGDLESDFWFGLEKVYQLTKSRNCQLRVDVWDRSNTHHYAEYREFYIDDESNNYSLHVGGHSGDGWDRFEYHNNLPFSTKDRDVDRNPSANCAAANLGGWWHNGCFFAFFNTHSMYWREDPAINSGSGVRRASMKIRC